MELLCRVLQFCPPSSPSVANLACVCRLWRDPCQKELFRHVSLSSTRQVRQLIKSLLFHMGPTYPEPTLKLQLCVEQIVLEKDPSCNANLYDEHRFHYEFSTILPLFQRLKTLTYVTTKWDPFMFHRMMGHGISEWAPLSLTKLRVVVSIQ